MTLFAAVNDHRTTTAHWWWRHRGLRPALRAVPDLVGIAPDEVPAVLERHESTAAGRDRHRAGCVTSH